IELGFEPIVAVPEKLSEACDPLRTKVIAQVLPEMVPEAEPGEVSVAVTAQLALSRVCTPAAEVLPLIDVAVCVSVMLNVPPSWNWQPLEPGPVQLQVPVQVPPKLISKPALTV